MQDITLFIIGESDVFEFDFRYVSGFGKRIRTAVVQLRFFKYRFDTVEAGTHDRQSGYLCVKCFQRAE